MQYQQQAEQAEIAELKKQLARIELVSEGKPPPDAAMGVGNDSADREHCVHHCFQ